MDYTDDKLKQAMAKMLSEVLVWVVEDSPPTLCWKQTVKPVPESGLLQLCWDIEETLTCDTPLENNQKFQYYQVEMGDMHAPWQQRVIGLAKVKGVTI